MLLDDGAWKKHHSTNTVITVQNGTSFTKGKVQNRYWRRQLAHEDGYSNSFSKDRFTESLNFGDFGNVLNVPELVNTMKNPKKEYS